MEHSINQREFIEKYDSGQREFSNTLMQFFDVSNKKFSDIVIKDSKIMFCNFNSCEMKNVRIENCRIYFMNFYTGAADNLLFENCDIEQMLIDRFSFGSTKFNRCNIRWSAIFNSNSETVDLTRSTKHKFFTDISQVTSQDMEEAVKLIMHDIERLDVSIRLKIKGMIRHDISNYNLPNPREKKETYETRSVKYDDSPLTYGEVKGMVESAFGAYNVQDACKTKKSTYETDTTYK
ncbi:hypothetical protein HYZ41_01555 [archaeon]|nr:hypothetical protein [archaeon]